MEIEGQEWETQRSESPKERNGETGFFPPTTQEEHFADEKERKTRTLLLNGCSKRSSQLYMAWMMTKRSGQQQDTFVSKQKVKTTAYEELNHALMAFTVNNEVSMCSKLCLDSFNALQAKYDELQSEFGDQEAVLVAHKLAVKKLESQLKASHKQQSSLNEKLNFQANQIFEKDEKLKKYRRIGMKAVKDKDALQKIVDSWFASSKNLWKLIDCGMSSTVKLGLGHSIKSNAEVLGYEEEMSRGIFVLRETDEGYYDIPLYSRFKQVEYKGVPPPLSGDYTPRAQEDIDDSFDGELGTVTDHSVNDDLIHDQAPISSLEAYYQIVSVNSVTQFKSGASRFNTGCMNINTARVNRPVSNRPSPKPFQIAEEVLKNSDSKSKSPSGEKDIGHLPFAPAKAVSLLSILVNFRENTRRVVPVEITNSNALVSCDGSGYDWSDQAEEGPTNFALMAYSSTSSNSEVSTDSNCSSSCLENVKILKEQNGKLLKDLRTSKLNVIAYKRGLESVEARLIVYKINESVYEEDIKVLKCEIHLREVAITELRRKLELAQKQKDEIQLTVENFENSSKSLSKLIDCQIVDECKIGLGYNAVPPPYTRNFMPPKPDLSFFGLEEFVNDPIVSEPTVKKPVVESSEAKASADKPKVVMIRTVRKNNGALIIKDWVFDSEEEDVPQAKIQKKTAKLSFAKIEFVKSKEQVNLLGKQLLTKVIKIG
ncbi:hypothetical protein Tco_1562393 [Tanacetum coccineum]